MLVREDVDLQNDAVCGADPSDVLIGSRQWQVADVDGATIVRGGPQDLGRAKGRGAGRVGWRTAKPRAAVASGACGRLFEPVMGIVLERLEQRRQRS